MLADQKSIMGLNNEFTGVSIWLPTLTNNVPEFIGEYAGKISAHFHVSSHALLSCSSWQTKNKHFLHKSTNISGVKEGRDDCMSCASVMVAYFFSKMLKGIITVPLLLTVISFGSIQFSLYDKQAVDGCCLV